MKKRIVSIFLGVLIAICVIMPAREVFALSKNDKACEKAHVVADFNTGTIISSNRENERFPIASMVKITTLSIIFDAIDEGRISLNDEVTISEYAFSMGGSQAFLDNGATYSVEELVKSVIVASANDSCVALAEYLEGDVEAFVNKMNEMARELGMENTRYENCTGLPSENAYSSASDVLKITRYLMGHKKFFDYAKIWMYDLVHPSGRVTGLTNTNKLIRSFAGMDGGKTGYTDDALSCLSARATRGDTSLICVVIGAPSGKERNARVSALLNEGFSNYSSYKVVEEGAEVDGLFDIKNGKELNVVGVYSKDIKTFGKKGERKNFSRRVEIVKDKAPIVKNEVIAMEVIVDDEGTEYCVDILAKSTVDVKSYKDFVDNFIVNW